jgi:hypothetical protein
MSPRITSTSLQRALTRAGLPWLLACSVLLAQVGGIVHATAHLQRTGDATAAAAAAGHAAADGDVTGIATAGIAAADAASEGPRLARGCDACVAFAKLDHVATDTVPPARLPGLRAHDLRPLPATAPSLAAPVPRNRGPPVTA